MQDHLVTVMPQPDTALFSPLPRVEVIKAVERRSPARVRCFDFHPRPL